MKKIRAYLAVLSFIFLSACGNNKASTPELPTEAMSYTAGNEIVLMDDLLAANILDVQSENPKLPDLNDTKGKSVAFNYTFDDGETIYFMVTDGVVSSGDMLLGYYDMLVEDIKRHEASLEAQANGIETQAAISGKYCWQRFITCQIFHGRKWENGIVFWEYPGLTVDEQRQVLRIIREYERRTDLRFVNRSTGKRIIFKRDGSGCNSWIGQVGGDGQTVNLSAADGCFRDAVIRHEIGHAIGLIHEHQRPDRDNHINILEQNIRDGQEHNFQRIGRKMAYQTSYDTSSIMQYGSGVFSIGSETSNPTMTTKGNWRIPYNNDLNANDVRAINSYY